jgi:hypothetical protein
VTQPVTSANVPTAVLQGVKRPMPKSAKQSTVHRIANAKATNARKSK